MTSEFIDAYSDDQTYLGILEDLVNSDPVESIVPENIKYSAFCRLWAVMMVGGVECMIKEWADNESALHDIYTYFDQGSNIQRIERLIKSFKIRGIKINIDHFEDFLVVKYIRNAYIHGEWKKDQRDYVVQRKFPETIMSFNASHFIEMKKSYDHVMQCLGMANTFNKLLARRN